jgi:hypothetical protein
MVLWNALFALSFIGVARYGDYITKECPQVGYVCPKICDVDHKHYPREECNGKAKQESKSDTTTVQPIKQLHKKAVGADKSEGL